MGLLTQLDSGRIKKLLHEKELIVICQTKNVLEIDDQLRDLANQRVACNGKKDTAELYARLLTNTLFIMRGIPKESETLRQQIMDAMEEVKRTDITVAKQTELQHLTTDLQTELFGICTHPFVTGYHGYRGSHSHDHEDGYNGQRFCLICSLTDTAKWSKPALGDSRDETYGILIQNSERLIDYSLIDQKGKYSLSGIMQQRNQLVWRPFNEIQKALLDPRILRMQELKFQS
jgi:hypothetical protein